MSYNKILFFLALVVLVVLSVLVFRNGDNTDQQVTDAISILKQSDDRSRDCEVFNKLVDLSTKSRRATLMLAEMYARGMCNPFDLEKSLTSYQKANLSNVETGQALFQAAIWEIQPSGKAGSSNDQLLSLFKKSKELGYRPTKNELDRLGPNYAAIFL